MEHKSIIEELFYCGVARNETFDKNDQVYVEAFDKVIKIEEQLFEKINGDKFICDKYAEYLNAVGNLQFLDMKSQYVSAFKFGVLLGMELMKNN
ncbi:MAG: hypothetical protein IJC87_00570 [Clostridia bacterium]|nr:hypothetical protein [Clostridia bacterium]